MQPPSRVLLHRHACCFTGFWYQPSVLHSYCAGSLEKPQGFHPSTRLPNPIQPFTELSDQRSISLGNAPAVMHPALPLKRIPRHSMYGIRVVWGVNYVHFKHRDILPQADSELHRIGTSHISLLLAIAF